jgi:hypothetical protein
MGGLFSPFLAVAQVEPCECLPMENRPVSFVSDSQGLGTGTVHWTCDTVYVLTETVFVNAGDVLTIDPGTVIMGRNGIVEDTLTYTLPNGNPSLREDYIFSQEAGSLVVSVNASIMAEGTLSCPIVFTYEGDPLDGSSGYDIRGRWGGLILCGSGALNTFDGQDTVEGIEDLSGQNRHVYGSETGTNPNFTMNSGVLKFISIRHASTSRGTSQFGNGLETNALTLCGVGDDTEIDCIEAVASADDGVQIFGGTVDVRHLGLAFNAEDGLEYDQGWQGNGQFIFSISDEMNGAGETGGDYEGDDYEEFDVDMTFMPFSNPLLYNQTYVGRGEATAIRLHNGAGVRLHNSVFLHYGLGIDFEDEDPCDAWELLLFGETLIQNNRFWDIGDSTAISDMILYNEGYVWNGQSEVEAHFTANNNAAMDPYCDFVFSAEGGFIMDPIDLTPDNVDFSLGLEYLPPEEWFFPADYIGAFSPDHTNWLSGWSYMESLGLFGQWNTPEGAAGGCMYSFACNFDSNATFDDGSCEILSCSGCTFPGALNYNEEAIWDDGTCELEVTNDCPEDINQDGQVNTTDLLMFLSAFGLGCF